jgi:hypothetical protein
MEASSFVRPASPQDAPACVAIYCPYVDDTAVTFETEVPDPSEMATRIAAARNTHEWLVLERDNEVIGYASAHAFNPRAEPPRRVRRLIAMRTQRWAGSVLSVMVVSRSRRGIGECLAVSGRGCS